MEPAELEWLAAAASTSRVIVEIGSWKGRSTKAIAMATPGVVYAVDHWARGSPEDGEEDFQKGDRVYAEFRRNLSAEIQAGKVIPLRGRSTEVAARADIHPDMIFIDGDHSYDSVVSDIDAWWPKISPEGILCGHDFNPETWPGVVRAVKEKVPGYRISGTIWWVRGTRRLPVTVVVPLLSRRERWFEQYTRPSIEANRPAEVIVVRDVRPASRARNQGIARAKSEFVICVDDDEILAEDCLSKMIRALKGHPEASFAYCDYLRVNRTGIPGIGPFYVHRARPFDARALINGNYIDTTSLVRREDHPGWDERLDCVHDDWDLWLTMVAQGRTGVYVPEILFQKWDLDSGLTAAKCGRDHSREARWSGKRG